MSTTFGYCRVSTLDQHTGLQEEAILKAHPTAIIRHEKASGTSTDGREVLSLLLDMIQEDDKLVVWKLDRLARNVKDLTNIVDTLRQKGASIEIIDQRIDTSTPSGTAFIQMLGVFAEFETNLRKERQLAGIEQAKLQGKYKGRGKTVNDDEVKRLKATGMGASDIAKTLGIGRASVYRALKAG